MAALIWAGVVVPVAGAVLAGLAPDRDEAAFRLRAALLVTAVAWAVVALGGDLVAGPLAVSGPTAPAAAGVALLASAMPISERQGAAVIGLLTTLSVAGLAASSAEGTPVEAAAAMAAGLAVAVLVDPMARRAATTVAAGGAAAVLVGLALQAERAGTFDLVAPVAGPVAVLVAGGAGLVAAACAGSVGARAGAPALLLPVALSVGVAAAGAAGDSADAVAATAAVAAAAASWRGGDRQVPAWVATLALWSLAASALSGPASSAPWLLGAAAVIVAVARSQWALAAAAPGAAVLAADVIAAAGALPVLIALLAAATVGGLVHSRPSPLEPPDGAGALALLAGAWLLLLPGSWAWAGQSRPAAWTGSLALAAGGAAAVLAAAWLVDELPTPTAVSLGPVDGTPSEDSLPAPVPMRGLLPMTTVAALAVAAGLLVASGLRAAS